MLHPQARALLDLMEQRGVPPTHTLTPAEARRLYRERRAFTQPEPPQVALAQDLIADGTREVPLRLYRPQGSPAAARLPVLVYYHGGGWVIGDLDTHDVLCRELANLARCAVVSVHYRLAPEHPFPGAVDDCIVATDWVWAHADALALDRDRIAVGGDSAGGNLAAVVALAVRDRGGPMALAFQLLIYPATDQRRQAESHRINGEGYLLTRESMDYYHDHYLGGAEFDGDWRASPLLHADHSRLPPALVLTAGHDPLRDEGLQYAQRLSDAGNRATHVCFERQIHGFITMGRVLDEAHAAVALCATELRRAFAA
jgi:acetyl esterase